MNVLRCDNLDCQAAFSEAPTILDFLDPDSHKHFTSMLEALDELRIPYQLNPFHAGPEGFSQTNVAIKYKYKDQTYSLAEAGYHDKLMESVAGKNWCSFGLYGSLLQIQQLLELSKISISREGKNDVYLVPLGELAAKKSLRLFRDLTTEKVSVYDHFGNIGVKNQLKQAQEFHAPIALIMGQKEAMDELVILRDVKSGMQEVISYDKIVSEVKKRLGR
jgi:histidyl-tRNA synthetase